MFTLLLTFYNKSQVIVLELSFLLSRTTFNVRLKDENCLRINIIQEQDWSVCDINNAWSPALHTSATVNCKVNSIAHFTHKTVIKID